MRLSMSTLLLLARCGDVNAAECAVYYDKNRDAEAWSMNGGKLGVGRTGFGWNGRHLDIIPSVKVGYYPVSHHLWMDQPCATR